MARMGEFRSRLQPLCLPLHQEAAGAFAGVEWLLCTIAAVPPLFDSRSTIRFVVPIAARVHGASFARRASDSPRDRRAQDKGSPSLVFVVVEDLDGSVREPVAALLFFRHGSCAVFCAPPWSRS